MANLENIDDNLKNQNDAYAKSHKEQIASFKLIQKLKKQILEVEKLETEESKKQLVLLKQQEKIETKNYTGKKKIADVNKKELDHTKKLKKAREQSVNFFKDYVNEFKKMTPEVQKQLTLDRTKGELYMELGARMSQLKNIVETTSGIVQQQAQAEFDALQSVSGEMKAQADMTAEAINLALGFNESEYKQKIRLIKLNEDLSKADKERAIAGLKYAEHLEEKTEIINELAEKRTEIFGEVNEELKSSIKGAMGMANAFKKGGLALGLIGLALAGITLAVSAFVDLDKAAEEYRKTSGFTAKQTEHLEHQVHEVEVGMRKIGVEASHVYNVINSLGNSFSDVVTFSTETLGALSAITARTGTTSDVASKVQAQFEQIGGYSSETAASLQMQVASLSQQAGVSPKEVLEDIADSAEVTSKFFKGDITLLKNQAIEAHRLGTNLESVSKVAEGLLDFETGIEEELKAATFVGGQFNLSRARALAYEGKIVQAQEETISQIQRSGDFRKKDFFTQTQLAKAAGMTVEQVTKQIGMQEKLSKLGGKELENAKEAINAGLDISNIKDEDLKQKTEEFVQNQKITGQLTDMMNVVKQIGVTFGSFLLPPVKLMADGLQYMLDNSWALYSAMGLIAGIMYVQYQSAQAAAAATAGRLALEEAIIAAKATELGLSSSLIAAGTAQSAANASGAVGGIMGSFAKIPFGLGIPLAIAAIAGMFGLMSRGKTEATSVHDAQISSDGGLMVSGPKGMYSLDKNDSVVAGTGLDGSESSANANLNKAAVLGATGIGAGAAVNILVQEIKQMRRDMASKTNDVYMDGSKVSSQLKTQTDKSNRNNFSLA
jgi:hypothetical protein